MYFKFLILPILFNIIFASPPGTRDNASVGNHQKNWNPREDRRIQLSTGSSHLSEYYSGSRDERTLLDISTPNHKIVPYTPFSTSGAKKESFSCAQCGKSYTTPQNLKRHVDSTHKGRTFDCAKCGRKFSRKDSLLDHDRAEH